MFGGPVFTREAATLPRRGRFYFTRGLYVAALLLLMCTAWMIVAGTQIIRNVGDMARFGSILFQILAPLHLALFVFLSAISAASSVSQEKDRRTLILLLMTRLSNSELVLGKLLASLLGAGAMLLAGLPVFLLITLLGGVSFLQVLRVFLVTVAAAIAAGSLGSTLAFWREKTFQTLSMTALLLLFWLGFWEAVQAEVFFESYAGRSAEFWAAGFSPVRAMLAAVRPAAPAELAGTLGLGAEVLVFLASSLGISVLLNAIAIVRVRVWNPSRELKQVQREEEALGSDAESARATHVDSRSERKQTPSREVWDNPILWREMCTWAYGRKVLVVRFGYLIIFGLIWYGIATGAGQSPRSEQELLPASAGLLAPLLLVSLAIINALAVTSITNERDGQALDLLLATDLSPREFIFGKLGGVLWVTREMVLLPMLLCAYVWWQGNLTLENLLLIIGGLTVMAFFVTMLGVHAGLNYANSRHAIGVSLGTLFFLFLGVVACLLMMISFSGSFQTQLAPFLAFILGGSVGLFVSLGSRNPSPAIALAALLLPFATFFAITSFLIEHYMTVFLVASATYGFASAAMLMPAIGEFDVAMGRTKLNEE